MFIIASSLTPPPHTARLTNDFIRSGQHVGRNCQTDLLGCLEIDDELEFLWLLYGQVNRLGAFQDLVHVRRGTLKRVGQVSIRHKAAVIHKISAGNIAGSRFFAVSVTISFR